MLKLLLQLVGFHAESYLKWLLYSLDACYDYILKKN